GNDAEAGYADLGLSDTWLVGNLLSFHSENSPLLSGAIENRKLNRLELHGNGHHVKSSGFRKN
ncbi:MAG TPA: hypothetical protein PKD05_02900, partial [Candidatus Melainabacteria bacterium]|nr:hypothetical protein [Candidatus Melainabacteria bacterium]